MGVYEVYANSEPGNMWRQCYGKQRYDKRGAVTAAKKVHQKGRVKAIRVYSCGDHWHIAKQHDLKED